MEERSEQPFVVAFHDFMSDSEVEHYKAEAVKNMIRKEQSQYDRVVVQDFTPEIEVLFRHEIVFDQH